MFLEVDAEREALANGGVCVLFGAQGAMAKGRRNPFKLIAQYLRQPRFSPLGLMLSNKGIAGYMIEPWKRARPDLYRADLATVFALAAEGRLTPAIAATYTLADACVAHEMINVAGHSGKLVIEPWS